MNRVLKFTSFIALVLLFASCSVSTFNIEGKIINKEEGSLYFWILENGEFVQKDKIEIKDGTFSFSYKFEDEEVAYITSSEKFKFGKVLFLENNTIETEALVFGDLFRVKTLKGEGVNSLFFGYEQETTAAYKKFRDGSVYAEIDKLTETFITNNTGNIAGLYCLYDYSKSPDKYSKVKRLYSQIGEEGKSYNMYSLISHNIQLLESITPGNKAIDFNYTTLEGKQINNDTFKGKVLMIDFWASWCGPCCQELPHVKEVYEKYHSQGFEVLGISLDSKKKNWLSAIEKYDLSWHNYSELDKWNCSLAKKYFVRGIPYNVIIDKEGNIAAKGLHGEKLEKTIEELLSK